MGTRSVTTFSEAENQKPFAAMYRQFDGYLSGHGKDLSDRFGKTEIVNGIGSKTQEDAANGMGCFAAQVVKFFKEDIGGIYLASPDSRNEYNYHLFPKDGKVWVRVTNGERDDEIYVGPLADIPQE